MHVLQLNKILNNWNSLNQKVRYQKHPKTPIQGFSSGNSRRWSVVNADTFICDKSIMLLRCVANKYDKISKAIWKMLQESCLPLQFWIGWCFGARNNILRIRRQLEKFSGIKWNWVLILQIKWSGRSRKGFEKLKRGRYSLCKTLRAKPEASIYSYGNL